MGLPCSRASRLDAPIALGIGGIGFAIASIGVHKVKTCSGTLLVGGFLVAAREMARGPAPPLKWWDGRRERALACAYTPGA